ncbi:MAG TPA: response regulator [Kofleriaceae bacterium]|nr:response regulator [Kofleriaceae bacterium]
MPKIMVIDDSNSMRALIKQALTAAGHQVIEAVDGQDALDRVATPGAASGIDLFLCDVNMPRVDGLTLVKKLRDLAPFKFKPILMLTTEIDPEKKRIAKEAGATGWLVKPFQPDQLLATIRKVLT